MTKSKSTSTLVAGAAAILFIALAAGCGSNNASGSTAPPPTVPKTAPSAAPTIAVGSSGIGNILVDSQGRTVYMFGADSGTTSTCTGACAVAWPPVPATGTPTAGNGAKAALVATTSRPDGIKQISYSGHPLYTFVGDHQAGDTNGQGRIAFGGAWSALSPAGVQISPLASSPSSTAPTPPAPPPTTMAPSPRMAPAGPRVPQNGGGDGDSDNNGGPDDGDGGV